MSWIFRRSSCLYPILSYMGMNVKCNIICNYVVSEFKVSILDYEESSCNVMSHFYKEVEEL